MRHRSLRKKCRVKEIVKTTCFSIALKEERRLWGITNCRERLQEDKNYLTRSIWTEFPWWWRITEEYFSSPGSRRTYFTPAFSPHFGEGQGKNRMPSLKLLFPTACSRNGPTSRWHFPEPLLPPLWTKHRQRETGKRHARNTKWDTK